MRQTRILVVPFVLALSLAFPSNAPAECVRVNPNLPEAFQHADLVFRGKLFQTEGTLVQGFVLPDGALSMKFGWTRFVPGRHTIDGHRLDGTAAPLRASIPRDYGDSRFETLAKHYIAPTPRCRFEFDYPADWVATAIPDDETTICRVRLRPSDFDKRMANDDVDVYTLEVGTSVGNFRDVAADKSFEFSKGKWVAIGRQGLEEEAETVTTDRWSGVKGEHSVGCFHESGGYAGLCDHTALVVRDHDENVVEMSGGSQAGQAMELVFKTFRFVGVR